MHHDDIRVQISRGGLTESRHSIQAAIVSFDGSLIDSWGDIQQPVYPRSAIKAMQALPLIEASGHKKFGFTEAEIALCCASHNGEPEHVATVQNMLDKIGHNEADFECGCHWPMRVETGYQLSAEGRHPNQLHNNCSGKHAGMLALSQLLNVSHQNYVDVKHPIQREISRVMAEMCETDYDKANWSPDGCSAPTWAIPLYNLALAYAKFAYPHNLAPARREACLTIFNAVVNNPFMVAGTERYCTDMMEILGSRVFLKTGAEGVYIAAIPELKLAIALKSTGGATRAAESAMTALLDHVGITKYVEDKLMDAYRTVSVKNWNKITTGDITCSL